MQKVEIFCLFYCDHYFIKDALSVILVVVYVQRFFKFHGRLHTRHFHAQTFLIESTAETVYFYRNYNRSLVFYKFRGAFSSLCKGGRGTLREGDHPTVVEG